MNQLMRPAVAGLMVLGALGACKKADNYADTTAAAAARVDTGTAARVDTAGTPANPSATPGAPANSKWSTNSIVGYVNAANDGEVQLGKLGEKKATAADVKAFARQMVTDHTAMRTETKTLGGKLKVVPDTTYGDTHDLANHVRDEIKDLTDKAAGADWDKNFMDKMIDDHKNVLDKLQDAAKNTQDADLRKSLEAAVGKVQTHLTKAEDIKSKMK